MITIDQLTYTYPASSQQALQGVALHIEVGEFVLLTGQSGSGKSTLLRSINGLVPHFSGGKISGQVTVAGLDVIAVGPQVMSRHVGFVQQNPEGQAVLDRVEPEIAFALENIALAPQEMRIRVEEVLDLLDLTALRQRPLTTLSGGERQRVAIATALALRPQILLLDEPTSQLDPQSAEDVLRALVRLNEDLGLTIVLAEHRLERVLRYADRLIHMTDGQISADGSVRETLTQIEQVPPLVELGRHLHWQPLPLTIKEGRRLAAKQQTTTSTISQRDEGGVVTAVAPLLTVRDIHFAYNGHATLKGVDIDVAPGEAVALMGRNGSGKSTLLKCIMGLLQAEKGVVHVNGRNITHQEIAEIARIVAYLPQNPDDLLFAETVADELRITLQNHGLIADDQIDNTLAELGLAQVADVYPRDLSVGQRQRVALGAVTVTQPQLLLLDEPTRGLDYHAKQALVAIWQQKLTQGTSLLLVTHDVELAALIADRVIILSQGELIANGSPHDVLAASPLFAPQIAKLFPGQGWLTVADALSGLKNDTNSIDHHI